MDTASARECIPADVAALAVHIMTNTALTGATYDIDGGQRLIPTSGGCPPAVDVADVAFS